MENILTTLFPTNCYFCNTNPGSFCRECLQKCKEINESFCIVCEKPSLLGETHIFCEKKVRTAPKRLFSAYEYTGVSRNCIRTAKYASKLFFPLKTLTFAGVKALTTSDLDFKDFVVIPIPLTRKKARIRGFNQANLIAEVLSKQLNLQLSDDALKRVKDTKSQYGGTREERFDNLKNAFGVASAKVKNQKILLVDDICTSGATFFEATRILYAAGAEEVSCFSLAKKFLMKKRRS